MDLSIEEIFKYKSNPCHITSLLIFLKYAYPNTLKDSFLLSYSTNLKIPRFLSLLSYSLRTKTKTLYHKMYFKFRKEKGLKIK